MKTLVPNGLPKNAGYSLLTVMMMTGVSLGLYASAAKWAAVSANLNERNNTYFASQAAAEGATEQVITYMARDFASQKFNPASLSGYQGLVPTNDWAAQYQFSDNEGSVNRTFVNSSATMVLTNLNSQFAGLYGLAYSATVTSTARPARGLNVPATVEQDLQLASIPIFQFAIFYSMDLEINPGAQMKVTGKVHSNGDLYCAPRVGLEFMDGVGSVGRYHDTRNPNDPQYGSAKVEPVFDDTNSPAPFVSSLALPVGTNNSPAAVRSILEVPPTTEDPNSQIGQQRYYNKADLIVTVTPTNTLVQTGEWNSFQPISPDLGSGTNATYSFVTTNNSFYDAREQKNTIGTDLDVGALTNWIATAGASINNTLKFATGHSVNSVYINDARSVPGKLTVARVTNGRYLPQDGLTVATSQPLYVRGNFNAPDTTIGSTNTSTTKPASLLGDAITILSGNWSDANSSKSLGNRLAIDTTVNAAILSGIVQTTNSAGTKHYSGGVENYPRFLEDWTGKALTYNGSMVVMFPSKYATNWWIDPGTYYNPPVRDWAFDVNFLNVNKLPPGTPQVRKIIRSRWAAVASN
ncbi:MAG TPA: hypothetical protein VKY92_13410 [Verrucomicrobiae bacterium]|nr:hypothetical protein [Verrucomicrobiae bacterium]